MGEELALSNAHKIPLIILRPCAVYGPRERDIYTFFKLLSKKIKPYLSGVEQHISLCYVDDIIQAILLAAQSQQSSGEIFFLSDGEDYRLGEVGDIFAQTMRVNAYSIRIPEWMMMGMVSSKFSKKPPLLNKGKMEEILQKNWVCDITKAKTDLGFEPHILLEQGAKLTFEWYKKENWL
jgi:nucleoside-diphosphate-sugar epimerase